MPLFQVLQHTFFNKKEETQMDNTHENNFQSH